MASSKASDEAVVAQIDPATVLLVVPLLAIISDPEDDQHTNDDTGDRPASERHAAASLPLKAKGPSQKLMGEYTGY